MHNCRLTRNGLIDLALDEMPSAEAKQLLAELDDCSACREEYATLRNTWRVSGQALRSALPTENFWPGYHARLQAKLGEVPARAAGLGSFVPHLEEENENPSSSLRPVRQAINSPLWLRIWIAVVTQTVSLASIARKLALSSVQVPVPLALALMFIFGITVFALRGHSPSGPVNVTPSNQLAKVETKTVQVPVPVPVIQERVVTRVVYLEKRVRRSRGAANQPDRVDLNAPNSIARVGSDASGKTAMSLVGFKPTDQVRLTIIKGSYHDEK